MLTDADGDVARRDSALPNLRIALDPELLSDWVASLWPGGGVQSVTPSYLRYKPSTSCLVQFLVTTDEAEHSAYAVFFRDRESSKMGGLPIGSVAADDALLVPYPGDRRIRGLERIAESDALNCLVNRLGLSEASTPQFQLLRHKPERRVVGVVSQEGRALAALRLYSRRDFGVAKRAFRAARWAAPELKYLGSSDRVSAVATGWIDGNVAGVELTSRGIEAVANRLAMLHRQRRAKLQQFNRLDWGDRLESAIRSLRVVAPSLVSLVAPSLPTLRTGTARAEGRGDVTHGDAHLDQFVIDPETGEARLIDFDRAMLSAGEWDIANVYADLIRRGADFGLEQVVQAYGQPVDQCLLKAMTALRLLEIAIDPFRNRHPDWYEKSKRLVDSACLTLSGSESATARTSPLVITEAYHGSPVDPDLSTLRDALNPDTSRPRFLELRDDRGVPCGVILSQTQVRRHKLGRRCLIEYFGREVASGKKVRLLGKLESKPRSERRLNDQRLLWDNGFDDGAADGICVARPWAAIPEWRLWLQQRVPGTTATVLLQKPGGDVVARRLGEAIAKLHQTDLPCRSRYSVDKEAALLHDRLSRAANVLPALTSRLLALRDRCVELALSLETSDITSVHRDFYSDQAIVDSRTITLVDFDLLCRSDPSIDIGNFLGCLVERGVREGWQNGLVERLSQAFRVGYGPNQITDRAGGYLALTVARHVAIAVDRDDRRQHTMALLSLAEGLVDEGVINVGRRRL